MVRIRSMLFQVTRIDWLGAGRRRSLQWHEFGRGEVKCLGYFCGNGCELVRFLEARDEHLPAAQWMRPEPCHRVMDR